MDVLVATRTVHESAAACDHLADRDGVERVVGVGVAPADDPVAARDAGEALTVLEVRLAGLDVTTAVREGDAVAVVREAVAEHGVDEVVVAEGFAEVDGLPSAVDTPIAVAEDPATGG